MLLIIKQVYSNILLDVIENLGAGGPVVNSPSVDRGITTLAIKLNLNSYMGNINSRTL